MTGRAESGRRPFPRIVGVGTLVLAIVVWQTVSLQEELQRIDAMQRRLGEALAGAAEAVAIRECRGGRAVLDELAAAMAETREVLEVAWIAIREPRDDAEPLVASGVPVGEGLNRFRRRFRPLRPQGLGFGQLGPRRHADVVALAPELELLLDLDPTSRREARSLAWIRGSTAAVVLSLLVVGFGVGVTWRGRAARLRADLAQSRSELASLETLRRLGAGLAHETRNPLGIIRGLAERLQGGRLPDGERPAVAGSIVEETDRLVARLDEFLLLSRPASLRRAPVAVDALVADLAGLCEAEFTAAGGRLEVGAAAGWRVDADPEQLRRLLLNLLLNAARALGGRGLARLAFESEAGARFVVEDDGPGVLPELRETLFEPYVSGREGGSGLGLAIARRIAVDHGFTLRHEPGRVRGARFVLELHGMVGRGA